MRLIISKRKYHWDREAGLQVGRWREMDDWDGLESDKDGSRDCPRSVAIDYCLSSIGRM